MITKKPLGTLLLAFLVLALFVGFSSLFIVTEGQNAMLLKLGAIVQNNEGKVIVYNPGLHVKLPFIESAVKFDTRLQTLDAQSSRILTAGQKYVLVDYYVKWRVADLTLYYTRTSNDRSQAELLLRQKINDALRAEFGAHTLSEVVSGSRDDIMGVLRKKAAESGQDLGISIIDVRIKGIDLPKEVSQSVFANMRSDREKAAAKYRADGNREAEVIRAKADATVTVTLAQAKSEALKIMAEGDKEAATIYAAAYDKNTNFYEFYRSLKAYTKAFGDGKTLLVLRPQGKFFEYFDPKNHASKRSV